MNPLRNCLILLTICASTPALADPVDWGLAVKGGLLMEGEVHYDSDWGSSDFDTESSWLLMANADRWVSRGFAIGAFGMYSTIELSDFDDESTFMTGGATFKTRFQLGPQMELRPGIAIGYQHITPEDDEVDTITGLGVGGMVDLAYTGGDASRFVGTFGFISQPAGGNDDFELTFDPIFYVAAGLEFGG